MSVLSRLQYELKKLVKREALGPFAFEWATSPEPLPETVAVAERRWRLFYSKSPLAIRQQILQHGEDLVVLTPLDAQALGFDLLAHFHRGKLKSLPIAQIYNERLQATLADRALLRDSELAQVFTDLPDAALPRVQGTVLLGEDLALAFWQYFLGWPVAEIHAHALFTWLGNPKTHARWLAAPEPVRRLTPTWLASSSLGALGGLAARQMDLGQPLQVLSYGVLVSLMKGVVAQSSMGNNAKIRMEERCKVALDDALMRLWGRATDRWLDEAEPEARNAVLQDSEALLAEFGLTEEPLKHRWLPSSLEQGTVALSRALLDFLERPDERGLTALVEILVQRVAPHRHLSDEDRGVLFQIPRLCRYLLARQPQASVGNYVHHEAWADVARLGLVGGAPLQRLQVALEGLMDTVAGKRDRFNRAFAGLAANLGDGKRAREYGLPIEHFQTEVVTPLARQMPVLWIVMDGMSVAAFVSLVGDLAEADWQAHRRAHDQPVIAALPTTTAVSRTSLFAGRMMQGNQAQERKVFAERWGERGVLFHKKAVSKASDEVLRTIRSSEKACVAVVINAVDDALAGGDQIRPRWTADQIPLLKRLMEAARKSNRAVILVSDHGHVLDFGSQYVSKRTGGERFARSFEGQALSGEIDVFGDRVMDGPLRLPWSERLRMGRKTKLGYHGGVSPQEVVVPWAVFICQEPLPTAWRPLSWPPPDWWLGLASTAREEDQSERLDKKAAPAIAQASRGPETPTLGKQVVASAFYREQIRRFQDTSLTPELVTVLLDSLAVKSSLPEDQVASLLGLRQRRLQGFLMKLQRVLNSQGVTVLRLSRHQIILELDYLREMIQEALGSEP